MLVFVVKPPLKRRLQPRTSRLQDTILNFKYYISFKIKNIYDPVLSRILFQSNKTISRPPQSLETIPFKQK
jgi:hypothetical protein